LQSGETPIFCQMERPIALDSRLSRIGWLPENAEFANGISSSKGKTALCDNPFAK
jgi:hypothetical protein